MYTPNFHFNTIQFKLSITELATKLLTMKHKAQLISSYIKAYSSHRIECV